MAGHGVMRFVELGAGKVLLTGLLRRMAPETRVMKAGIPTEVGELAASLGA